MISVILVIITVGVLLWAANTYIPLDAKVKQILNIVVILVLIIWLLNVFGLLPVHDVPVPKVK